MNEQVQTDTATRETLGRIEEHVRYRLTGLLQLAQHAVMEASSLPIRANEMEVS
jgi:hypothetical protein